MAIRDDSYGSVDEVKAFTRYLLGGQSTFNSTTQPTITEVEKFIDRASGHLNVALSKAGFSTPVSNTTAALSLDDWVVARATEYVELTQRGQGFSDAEGSRYIAFRNMRKAAEDFVDTMQLGLKRLGVTVTYKASDGLAFTGLDAKAERDDPSDTSLAQPKFERGMWDTSDTSEEDS
jgi:hypothetical protein